MRKRLSMLNRNCPLCHKGKLRSWTGTSTYFGVKTTSHGVECPACGEVYFTAGEIEREHQIVAKTVVARGIAIGREFRFIRKRARLQAAELAEILGVTPETVSRWENDAVPIPRLAAFALGELYQRPRATRAKLEAFAAAEARR